MVAEDDVVYIPDTNFKALLNEDVTFKVELEQRHIDTRYTIMIRRSGTYLASDGKWYYLRNKEIDTSYTGMAKK